MGMDWVGFDPIPDLPVVGFIVCDPNLPHTVLVGSGLLVVDFF